MDRTSIRTARMRAKLNSSKDDKALGGFLKSAVPTVLGKATSLIPGVGDMLSPIVSGMATNAVTGNEKQEKLNTPKTKGKGSFGNYEDGGFKDDPQDPKLPSQMDDSDRIKPTVYNSARGGRYMSLYRKYSKDAVKASDPKEKADLKTKAQGYYGLAKQYYGRNKKAKEINEKAGEMLPDMVEQLKNENLSGANFDFEQGGFLQSIGQDAVKFKGPSHEDGGIALDENTEVEGEETMDNVEGSDYIFSKKLKVPGTKKSFAQVHEALVQSGAGEEDIAELAKVQEQVSGRDKKEYGGALRKKYGGRR